MAMCLELRQRAGLDRSVFAKILGVSTETMRRWENGRQNPGKPIQEKLQIIEKKLLELDR